MFAVQGFLNALKSVEKQLGLLELSVLSWVSAVKRCPLSEVPLYKSCISHDCVLNTHVLQPGQVELFSFHGHSGL